MSLLFSPQWLNEDGYLQLESVVLWHAKTQAFALESTFCRLILPQRGQITLTLAGKESVVLRGMCAFFIDAATVLAGLDTQENASAYILSFSAVSGYGPWTIRALCAQSENFRKLFRAAPSSFRFTDRDAQAFRLAETLYSQKTGSDFPYGQAGNLLLAAVFVRISSYIIERYQNIHTPYRHMRKALVYMADHCALPMRVEQIAQAANVHPSYLTRLFLRDNRMAPAKYLAQLRLANAHRLLLDTTLSVERIAYLSGFSTLPYFTRVYGQEKGVPPGQMRRTTQVKDPGFPFFDQSGMGALVIEFVRQLPQGSTSNPCVEKSLLDAVLGVLQSRTAIDPVLQVTNAHLPAMLQHVLSYMENHYAELVSVSQIAQVAGVHVSFLHKLFRRYLAQTPSEYLTQIRMQQGMRLLADKNLNISDVALLVGIVNVPRFSKLFRAYTGQPPNVWRRS